MKNERGAGMIQEWRESLNSMHMKIHFVGIGGISMSGLAMMLKDNGHEITGSDKSVSEMTGKLEETGIKVYIGQKAENIEPGTNLLVYTVACADDNPEIIYAREAGITVIDRAELLGAVMSGYRYPVCVSGMHGKTTVSWMIAQILLYAEYDPSLSIGGISQLIGANYRIGRGDFFVAEACEYHDSFLKFYPHIGLILNVEAEHLDYFDGIEHVRRSFKGFAGNISEKGALIIHSDTAGLEDITRDLKCKVYTFGGDSADFRAENIRLDQDNYPSYDLTHAGRKLLQVRLNIRGLYNVQNSVAAAAAALLLGVSADVIGSGLYSFLGAKRRFETKGVFRGVTVIDEYSHHPTAIRACLSSARQTVRDGKVYCVFQPHTYSRTRDFLNEFGEAFTDADEVLVLDIYAAREIDTGVVHSRDLVREINRHGKARARYFSSFVEAENFLFDRCVPNDMLITMGAGDVYLLGEEMLRTDLSTLSTIAQ